MEMNHEAGGHKFVAGPCLLFGAFGPFVYFVWLRSVARSSEALRAKIASKKRQFRAFYPHMQIKAGFYVLLQFYVTIFDPPKTFFSKCRKKLF